VLIEKQIPKNKKLEHAGLEAHAHALASYFFSFLIGRTTRPYLLKKKKEYVDDTLPVVVDDVLSAISYFSRHYSA
jgi:phosphatidylglycerophosphatase A